MLSFYYESLITDDETNASEEIEISEFETGFIKDLILKLKGPKDGELEKTEEYDLMISVIDDIEFKEGLMDPSNIYKLGFFNLEGKKILCFRFASNENLNKKTFINVKMKRGLQQKERIDFNYFIRFFVFIWFIFRIESK